VAAAAAVGTGERGAAVAALSWRPAACTCRYGPGACWGWHAVSSGRAGGYCVGERGRRGPAVWERGGLLSLLVWGALLLLPSGCLAVAHEQAPPSPLLCPGPVFMTPPPLGVRPSSPAGAQVCPAALAGPPVLTRVQPGERGQQARGSCRRAAGPRGRGGPWGQCPLGPGAAQEGASQQTDVTMAGGWRSAGTYGNAGTASQPG
jgi:hypothetical protein